MKENQLFRKEVWTIALPITMQSLLQSSFGVVDQIMTGRLGSTSIAAIGLAGKFTSLYTIIISAVAVGTGILIAQYIGEKNKNGVSKSFFTNLAAALVAAVLFTAVSILFPKTIMGIYITDKETIGVAADYLKIYAISYIPTAVSTLLSAYLRCVGAAALPLYTSIAAAVANTALNYVLIFGKFGCLAMGTDGAAIASVIAQAAGCLLLLFLFLWEYRKQAFGLIPSFFSRAGQWKQYAAVLLPILVCEFAWGLGENVYALIYGHLGVDAYAAMMLTNPIQALTIGALSGVSSAAGIMIGKNLGAGENEKAYRNAKRFMLYGLAGSVLLSVLLAAISGCYVLLFQVEEDVRLTAQSLLLVFAVISPVKVQNMILGGGIIRSGGKTTYVMAIDLIGTWVFGVPLGLLAAFVWELPIPAVYFILSLEECVRFGISAVIFRKRIWMQKLHG